MPLSPELLEEAQRTWPGLRPPDAEFVAWAEAKLAGRPPSAARVGDLYVAYACAKRDPEAIAAFEQRYFIEVDAAAARFGPLPIALEDVRQRLRERFFVSESMRMESVSVIGCIRLYTFSHKDKTWSALSDHRA